MATGEFSLNVPIGIHNIVASNAGYTPQTITNLEVLEGQIAEVNFQLGGENMTTHTEHIVIMDGALKTINVPVEEPTVPKRFLDVDTPMVGKTVELLAEDGTTLIQTKITDAEGIATFENILHGNYDIKITF